MIVWCETQASWVALYVKWYGPARLCGVRLRHAGVLGSGKERKRWRVVGSDIAVNMEWNPAAQIEPWECSVSVCMVAA